MLEAILVAATRFGGPGCRSGALSAMRSRGVLVALMLAPLVAAADEPTATVADVTSRVRQHAFHPLNGEGTFTSDRSLKVAGVADLNDTDWQVRLLAIRDFVRLLPSGVDEISAALFDEKSARPTTGRSRAGNRPSDDGRREAGTGQVAAYALASGDLAGADRVGEFARTPVLFACPLRERCHTLFAGIRKVQSALVPQPTTDGELSPDSCQPYGIPQKMWLSLSISFPFIRRDCGGWIPPVDVDRRLPSQQETHKER